MNFFDTNRKIVFHGLIEDDDPEEISEEILEKTKQYFLKQVKKQKEIKKVSTEIKNDKDFTSIEEEMKNFIEYSKKTKKVKHNTFTEYQTSFNYLFLYVNKSTKVYQLEDINLWLNCRDFLQTLPNTLMRKYKEGDDITVLIENIIDDNDLKDKELKLLSNSTINKHYTTYNQFLDFLLLKQKIKLNPLDRLTPLEKQTNPYKPYTDKELKFLYTDLNEKEIHNFFNVLLYTGMRLSSVINIKKDNIDIKNRTLKIEDDKTLNGQRLIVIHNTILPLFEDYKKSKREYFLFDTNNKDRVQKYINPLIKSVINENKTIHSFRKNFTQKLFEVCSDINLRKYIVGHSQLRDITFTTYNQERVDIKKISRIINSISYDFNNVIDQNYDTDIFL